jgi:SAM-dependent methyltransferase
MYLSLAKVVIARTPWTLSMQQEDGSLMDDPATKLSDALWRIYNRPERPAPWQNHGNLPWHEPDFSRRMLREHLDETHGAASRVSSEREQQVAWLGPHLDLHSGSRLLDFTCGPGLYATLFAGRGCLVTGIDFSPASVAYANELALRLGVAERCDFIQEDVRQVQLADSSYDAATFIYGQLAVFPRDVAQQLLAKLFRSLKPGGKLCVELLNQERVDKSESSWWFTDDSGLWGDAPFLHLGERFWNEAEAISIERFHLLHLETGELEQVTLCDQTYSEADMIEMMRGAGFSTVSVHPAWDQLPLYDASEWIVYIAQRQDLLLPSPTADKGQQ